MSGHHASAVNSRLSERAILREVTALRSYGQGPVEASVRGWSRNEPARRARMAPGDVGRVEAGRLRPYDSQVKKLARARGLGPGDPCAQTARGGVWSPSRDFDLDYLT